MRWDFYTFLPARSFLLSILSSVFCFIVDVFSADDDKSTKTFCMFPILRLQLSTHFISSSKNCAIHRVFSLFMLEIYFKFHRWDCEKFKFAFCKASCGAISSRTQDELTMWANSLIVLWHLLHASVSISRKKSNWKRNLFFFRKRNF